MTASKIDFSTTTLGYRQITTTFQSTSGATYGEVPDLSTIFSLDTSTRVKVTFYTYALSSSATTVAALVGLFDGSVTSTPLQEAQQSIASSSHGHATTLTWIGTLNSGDHTLKIGIRAINGNTSLVASPSRISFILIEKY